MPPPLVICALEVALEEDVTNSSGQVIQVSWISAPRSPQACYLEVGGPPRHCLSTLGWPTCGHWVGGRST